MKKRSLTRWIAVVLTLVMLAQSVPLLGGTAWLKVNAATSQVTVPTFTAGTLHRTVELSNRNVGIYYTGATADEFHSFVYTTMVNSGFTVLQSNTIGSSRYATLLSEEGMAYVAYTASGGTLHIVTDPLITTGVKEAEPAYTKITENTFSIFSLEYSHYTCAAGCDPKYDNNGQCYIITLEDGRYVISDGGYEQDAERLYNFLYDNNKREDGEIVIAAWFLSHDHNDHVGCIGKFASLHGKDVTLQSVVANPTVSATSGYSGTWMTNTLPTVLNQFNGDAELIIPHTGQIYTYCNVDFEFYYTHEDMYHNNGSIGSNGNNTSTVFQMSCGGQTFMIPSDLMDAGCKRIVTMHGNAMKSDFFQIPHHGNSGCTTEFYEAVSPDYTLWTTSEPAFGKRTSGVTYAVGMPSSYTAALNKKIYTEVGASNCWCADGDVEIMQLPYSATSTVNYYTPTDVVKNHGPKASYFEDFSAYDEGEYTKEELANLLGWGVSGMSEGEVCRITSDGKLRLYVPSQDPTASDPYDFSDGDGTYTMNGELFFRLGRFLPFGKERAVLEFDMEYNESAVCGTFAAPFRIAADGSSYVETQIFANGTIDGGSLLKLNGEWQTIGSTVSPADIPYQRYTSDYMTNTDFQYPGYAIGNNSTSYTKSNDTIFGSKDHYKIVIDPENGIDIWVNGTVVFSTDCERAWRETYASFCIGETVSLRLMAGIDVTLDNIKIYAENQVPDLLITELAPNGTVNWNEYIEVYNNSTEAINIYDYCIVRDPLVAPVSNERYESSDIGLIKPASTVYQPAGSDYSVTHVNPTKAEGVLQAGESALLWIATNTSGTEGNGKTLADFRASLNLADYQKAFVCYNNYNFSLNNAPEAVRYGIGYASVDYINQLGASLNQAVGNLVSYVYHNTTAMTDANGDSYAPVTYAGTTGSIRYTYPARNTARHGSPYRAEANVNTAGVIETAQKREFQVTVNGESIKAYLGDTIDLSTYMTDPQATFGADMIVDGVTVRVTAPLFTVLMDADFFVNGTGGTTERELYAQNFDSIAAGSYTASQLAELLGWTSIKDTTGATYTVTADHKLQIRNPYTSGSNLEAQIGDFSRIKDHVIVLEYDFLYTNRNDSEGISNASFVIGHSMATTGSCIQPTITAQGFQQTRIGTKMSKYLYGQIRPEWIPYTAKATGYTYPKGSVKNHYQIFGGTNHVKVVIDPANGVSIYVNDSLISTPLEGNIWRSSNYDALIGSFFGLCITPGMDVTWDNIRLYETNAVRPELLITELGTSMGAAEFIELYNNSDRMLNLYDYCVVRNPDLTRVGTNWGSPDTFAKKDVATIKAGTHTYVADGTGQTVTLTNPTDGWLRPGEAVVLWIATNTTYTSSGNTQNGFTVEKFRDYHSLDDSVRVFACYNNNNFSLNDGGNIAYGIGYASENYVGRNTSSLEDLVCYVYANTTATSVYGNSMEVSVFAQKGASVEYSYGSGNMARQGRLYEAKTTTKSIGTVLSAQKRTVNVTIDGKAYAMTLGAQDLSAYADPARTVIGVRLSVNGMFKSLNGNLNNIIVTDGLTVTMVYADIDTLSGACIRMSTDTGMRWQTAIQSADYATLETLKQRGEIADFELGTLIMRTEDLNASGGSLTLELVGESCKKVVVTPGTWFESEPDGGVYENYSDCHIWAGSVVNIKPEHVNARYSAVGYLTVTFKDGTGVTVYGGYDEAEHARTVAYVAKRAWEDPNASYTEYQLAILELYASKYVPTA